MSALVCSPAEQIRLRTAALVTDLRARRPLARITCVSPSLLLSSSPPLPTIATHALQAILINYSRPLSSVPGRARGHVLSAGESAPYNLCGKTIAYIHTRVTPTRLHVARLLENTSCSRKQTVTEILWNISIVMRTKSEKSRFFVP